jgi:hypothetical protein
MTGSVEDPHPTAGRLTALLIDASTEAVSAAGGHAGGVYLRSRTPGLLRLAVLSGLPGPLFRPWWRLHRDGFFDSRDAAQTIADLLGVSRATVYNYSK